MVVMLRIKVLKCVFWLSMLSELMILMGLDDGVVRFISGNIC